RSGDSEPPPACRSAPGLAPRRALATVQTVAKDFVLARAAAAPGEKRGEGDRARPRGTIFSSGKISARNQCNKLAEERRDRLRKAHPQQTGRAARNVNAQQYESVLVICRRD